MVLTLPKERTEGQTDDEYASYLQDFDPAQEFLDKYTESTDPTETDFSVEAYEGDKGRGFFSPDGAGRPDQEIGIGDFERKQFESLRESDERTGTDRPDYRDTLARDRPSVRPMEQRSASDSRPNFRPTGRSFIGGYSRSQRTGSGASSNTGFSSVSSSNPNQNWGGYRSSNVAATYGGNTPKPDMWDQVIKKIETRTPVKGSGDYPYYGRPGSGMGDRWKGSDASGVDTDSSENFVKNYINANVGTQVATTDLSGVINESVKDPLVDSMGRPLNTVAAREVRRNQGVNRYGQKIISPSTVDLQEKAPSGSRIFDRYWWEDDPSSKRSQGLEAEMALYEQSQSLHSDLERRYAALDTLYGQTQSLNRSLSSEYSRQEARGDDADWDSYNEMYARYTPLSQQYDTDYADYMELTGQYESMTPVSYGTPEFDEKYGAEGTGTGKWLYENPQGTWYKSGDDYWTNYDTGARRNKADFPALGGSSQNTKSSGEQLIASGGGKPANMPSYVYESMQRQIGPHRGYGTFMIEDMKNIQNWNQGKIKRV